MLSSSWWDFWGCLMQGQELDSMILVRLLQLRIFYDLMTSGAWVNISYLGCKRESQQPPGGFGLSILC